MHIPPQGQHAPEGGVVDADAIGAALLVIVLDGDDLADGPRHISA